MISVRILGPPARVFYREARALPGLAGLGSPHELLRSIGVLRSGIDGETPNLTVMLSNREGQAARLFSAPPLGAQIEVRDAAGIRFEGTVQGFALGADCAISAEALLTRALPLRTSTIWGGYRVAVPLPHRYGETSGELIQYNETRTLWCWADHPCHAVDAVLIAGQPAGDWQAYTLVDASNHAITIVEFGQPVDEGVTPIARGRGKLHPVTGQPMTNPATVIWDVLANIGGLSIAETRLDDFRRECDVLGIEVGGSIEAADTPQVVAREICTSIGAAFCADAAGLCRILSGATVGAPRAIVRSGSVSATTALSGMCNDLTVQYGFEAGEPAGSVQVDAPDYVSRYGRIADALEARWITSPRVAYAVAARILGERARPLWTITVDAIRGVRDVFDSITLAHVALPIAGTFAVRERIVDLLAGTTQVTLVAPAGDMPAIRLVRQGVAFAAQSYVGATSQVVGTDRIYTITEADGRPIVGAAVTANGFTRYTDGAGRVAFPLSALPPGAYVFRIVAPDGREWPFPTVVT